MLLGVHQQHAIVFIREVLQKLFQDISDIITVCFSVITRDFQCFQKRTSFSAEHQLHEIRHVFILKITYLSEKTFNFKRYSIPKRLFFYQLPPGILKITAIWREIAKNPKITRDPGKIFVFQKDFFILSTRIQDLRAGESL